MAPTNDPTDQAKVDQAKADQAKANKIKIDHDVRGFSYFDSFPDLETWNEANVDPLQKANTPLLARPEIPDEFKWAKSSNVLVMHDYKNGFLESESCQGALTGQEYYMEHWQLVDTFNYFTHNRVSIPPPTYVNAGHRNGCLVLGTFCIESGGGDQARTNEILKKNDNGEYWLANVLGRMAACYGFDGYLINVETTLNVDNTAWAQGTPMANMLTELRKNLKTLPSGGKLIWFDALTKDNDVDNQDTLNYNNVTFTKAAGSIITNYVWNGDDLQTALKTAQDNGLPPSSVYIGTDCWGQTDDSDKKNTRETFGYNEEVKRDDQGKITTTGTWGVGTGHGGTATGTVLGLLAENNIGAGIFAQGWAYEHFPKQGQAIDRFMWYGTPDITKLPHKLNDYGDYNCGCKTSLTQHIRNDFKEDYIARFAQRWPAGSVSFFYTDYKDAMYKVADDKFATHLGQQAVLPLVTDRIAPLMLLQDSPSRCTLPLTQVSEITDSTRLTAGFALHYLNIHADIDLDVTMDYQLRAIFGLKFSLYATVAGNPVAQEIPSATTTNQTFTMKIPGKPNQRVKEVGVAISGTAQGVAAVVSNGRAELLDILSLSIKPTGKAYSKVNITNAKIIQRGSVAAVSPVTSSSTIASAGPIDSVSSVNHRLSWSIDQTKPDQPLLPWSSITGPYAYFLVEVEGKTLGRAYALEYIIDEGVYQGWKNAKKTTISFTVDGIAFDGTKLASLTGNVSLL